RHDDAAGEIVGAVDRRARRRRIDDAAILDVEVGDLAAPPVGRIDDATAGEQQAAHHWPPGSPSARSIAPTTAATDGSRLSRSAPSRIATRPSLRKACPG